MLSTVKLSRHGQAMRSGLMLVLLLTFAGPCSPFQVSLQTLRGGLLSAQCTTKSQIGGSWSVSGRVITRERTPNPQRFRGVRDSGLKLDMQGEKAVTALLDNLLCQVHFCIFASEFLQDTTETTRVSMCRCNHWNRHICIFVIIFDFTSCAEVGADAAILFCRVPWRVQEAMAGELSRSR